MRGNKEVELLRTYRRQKVGGELGSVIIDRLSQTAPLDPDGSDSQVWSEQLYVKHSAMIRTPPAASTHVIELPLQ